MSPIRASERARYPKDWKAISARILARAGDKCEWNGCGAPNGELIFRLRRNPEEWRSVNGGDCGGTDPDYYGVKIVLTVAHFDHTPENCAGDNLRAWCQLHHLRHDAKHHARNAGRTRRNRRGTLDLFTEAR